MSTATIPTSKNFTLDNLIADHGGPVLAYTRTLTSDHHAAEDIVQETMIRAWTRHDALQSGEGSIRGWLLTVARNLVIDRARSAASRHERSVPMPSLYDAAGSSAFTPDHADAVVDAAHVSSLLLDVSTEHRDVLVLTYVEGLSTQEVADRLGVPTGTVKSRRHHALGRIRERTAS